LIRPVAAFITFERQEGKDRAIKYFISEAQRKKEEKEANEEAGDGETDFNRRQALVAKVDKALLGNEIVVKNAPEPSEILWHNRHVTDRQALCNKVIAFVCSFIFLLGMFFLFTYMKKMTIHNMYRYPSTTNCNSVDSIFMVSDGSLDESLYKQYAIVDQPLTVSRQGTGIY